MSLAKALAKSERLDRCIGRIREEYTGRERELKDDYLLQDSVVLNLQRACEQAIDIAQILIRTTGLGRPETNGALFARLAEHGIIAGELAGRLRGLVGFRNIAVHEYEELDLRVVRAVIATELDALQRFAGVAVDYLARERGA